MNMTTDFFDTKSDTLDAIWRALSLTQPWATLVAIKAKLYETRSWRTSYRGWLAIHAAKGFPVECRELCDVEPFRSALHHKEAPGGEALWGDLPRGKVIAVAKLVDCIRIDAHFNRTMAEPERSFGDYTLGRYAWKLENIRRVKEPFEARGALSIWKLPRAVTLSDLI